MNKKKWYVYSFAVYGLIALVFVCSMNLIIRGVYYKDFILSDIGIILLVLLVSTLSVFMMKGIKFKLQRHGEYQK